MIRYIYGKEQLSGSHQIIRPHDEMRRKPKQERSRRMVNAIVDSAHKILVKYGRKGLSTTSLEIVSGVPKSSIYQYFPNLNSVVAEVYRSVVRSCHIKGYAEYPRHQSQTIKLFIVWLLDWSIDVHRKVMEVDKEIFSQHKYFLDTWHELDENLGPNESTAQFIHEQLKQCSDYESNSHDMMRVHALGRAAQLMVYSLISDDAEFIDDPAFRDMLARMCYAIFFDA